MKKSKLQPKLNPVWQKIYYAVGIWIVLLIVFPLIKGGFEENFLKILLIIFVFVVAIIAGIYFFSQFTLPVTNYKQRLQAASRLISYLSGNHGPAMFIEDGELRERKDERLKHGPGVILLDSASAAVLRTSTKFLGAIGPGIAFTEGQEAIAGVVDLHIQNQRLGPRIEEDPFLEKLESETEAAYEARIQRKNETRAMTRDGIEICANISAVFKIDAREGLGNTQFGYEPQAVERAIIGRTIDVEKPIDSPERLTSWKWIPALLAVDIWREYVSKITLNELFPLTKSETSQIEVILSYMRQRMVQETYQIMDDYGRALNRTETSPEFRILKNRGIKVIAVNIPKIYLPKPVEDQLINRWKSNWLGYAKKEKKSIIEKQAVQTQLGNDQANLDFAYGITHYLGSIPLNKTLSQTELLKSLINGNGYLVNQIPGLLPELNSEISTLRDIQEWIDSPENQS